MDSHHHSQQEQPTTSKLTRHDPRRQLDLWPIIDYEGEDAEGAGTEGAGIGGASPIDLIITCLE